MAKRNPVAAVIKLIKPTVVKARKGKGSYKRKPKHKGDING